MYTIYIPPHHKDKIERVTKEEAQQNEEDFDGLTTELRYFLFSLFMYTYSYICNQI